ncbi:Benzoylformate decarboxylase [Vanrija pseudolonga]|uniref:Benzoylformate decarboxylase n=1 Tax=Vanrija pseudolonga TaxID=143232 RepID=A0AAF0YAF7_9TREE|nr:Benzoylformate decarboxylase [Vanrija pseudolonga]
MDMTRRTVLDSTVDILLAHGLTTVFGNPGSNELPFLAGLPKDKFDYVLGLQEGVVVGMADGYAQSTGKAVLVSLHAASGTGNAMGALTNAHYSHSPLVLLAGQQIRGTVGQEVMLSNVDASILPRPLVKYSHEPLAASDVPRAVSQAILEASTHPKGPVYLSVPYDDWAAEALPSDSLLPKRRVNTAGSLSNAQLVDIKAILSRSSSPVVVVGPDVDAARAQQHVAKIAERLGAPVWIAPSAPRCPFPTTHTHYRGLLHPGIESVRSKLEGHDLVLLLGAPAMRYHRWEPGEYLPDGTEVIHLTCDPKEATRAPYGTAWVVELLDALAQLADVIEDRIVHLDPRTIPSSGADGTLTGTKILDVLAAAGEEVPTPSGTRPITYVNECTTLDLLFLDRVPITSPGGYHFPASGGLGFGMPAAVGVSLGRPGATVVAVIGDGSANYGITALYTAAQRQTRTVFVIVNNGSYGALRGFAKRLNALDAPGLDVPGIDFVSIATGYGVPATRVTTVNGFQTAYLDALRAEGPVLVEAVAGNSQATLELS